jgi:DNA-binding NarL/FixJ family response regulator
MRYNPYGNTEETEILQPRDCATILVVDDDDGLRAHLCTLLGEAGFSVVQVANGAAAIAAARAERPQAVVLDVCLPGLSGYEVCNALRTDFPDLPILFISGERTESFDRVAGLLIGGDDYLVKPFAEDELLVRLRALIRRRNRPQQRALHGLTQRELEVLGCLTEGLGQSAIAERLVISPKTVGTHIEHIFQKLSVRSRAQAVAAAYREHLVPEEVEAHQLTTP